MDEVTKNLLKCSSLVKLIQKTPKHFMAKCETVSLRKSKIKWR